jgi:hypothetical protein
MHSLCDFKLLSRLSVIANAQTLLILKKFRTNFALDALLIGILLVKVASVKNFSYTIVDEKFFNHACRASPRKSQKNLNPLGILVF